MTEQHVSAEGGQLNRGIMTYIAQRLRAAFLSPFFVPALVFFGFFVGNLCITGPAYLTDEIGYLSKASTTAGQPVHFVNSWYGGYSLLIAPAFLVTANPYGVWIFILLLNAAMWAGSVALLRYVLARLYRSASPLKLQLVTLGAISYPAWIAMSGYALATSGFVLVLLATLAALLKSEFRRSGWLIGAGILAGFLAWIHPVGYIFIIALVLVTILRFVMVKSKRVLLLPSAAIVMAALYPLVVSKIFEHVMRGSTGQDTHYASQTFTMLHDMTLPHFWLHFVALTGGLLFFTVVATFGIAVYAAIPFIHRLTRRGGWQRIALLPSDLIIGAILLSLVGVILMIALTTSEVTSMRPDQWIYGRYTDMFLLPVIGIGLMQSWKAKWGIWLGGFALLCGLGLQWIITPGNTGYTYINKLNLQAFWPLHVSSLIHQNHFWLWAILGALGVAAVGFFGTAKRKPWLLLLLLIVAASFVANISFHRGRVEDYALPSSSIYAAVTTLPAGTCVGFDTAADPNERFALYTYYFHSYNLRRLSVATWQAQCPGKQSVYLTLGTPPSGYTVRAIDAKYGVTLISH